MGAGWWVLALAAIAWAAILARRARLRGRTAAFLQRFEHLPALGAYRDGLARSSFGGPKLDHAVLLVHGFSASPSAFGPLYEALERQGIPYLAPALTGFGLDDFRLLERVRLEDWRRDVLTAYEQLAAVAREVSIVALSFGTLPATELALTRDVRHLVLVAPYFHLKGDTDKRMNALLRPRWARALGLFLMAYIAKPIRPGRTACVDIVDPDQAQRFFQYPTLPLASLLEIWRYPRDFDFKALRCRTLDVLYGEQEQTSDVPAFLADLRANGVPVRVHAFARSGHNLYSDHDAAAAVAATIRALTHEGEAPIAASL